MTNTSTTSSNPSLLALSGHAFPNHMMQASPTAKHGLRHRMTTALASIPYAIGLCCVWLFERDELEKTKKNTTTNNTGDKAVHRNKQPEDYDPWVVPMFWC